MPAAVVIALKDLKQRLRDRSAIVLGFVAPLAIALLMSSAFSGAEDLHLRSGFVNADGGPLASALRQVFADPQLADLVEMVEVDDEARARRMVDDGELGTAVVVPAGFSDGAVGAEPVALRVLSSTNAQVGGEVMRAITQSFVAQVNANRLSFAAENAATPPGITEPDIGRELTGLRIPVRVQERSIDGRELKTISYYGPSMGIFFMLFAVGFGARSFFSERANGTLDRLAAAPVRPAAILVGKALSVFAYGTLSLGTVVTVTSLFFGANWGSPVAVAALCVAMVMAVVALTMLVIAVARTERQAEGVSSLAVFLLALVGGNFVVAAGMPEGLRRLALATPNGWALRGFSDLAVGIPPVDAVTVPIAAILAFTAVVGGLAVLLSRRLVLS